MGIGHRYSWEDSQGEAAHPSSPLAEPARDAQEENGTHPTPAEQGAPTIEQNSTTLVLDLDELTAETQPAGDQAVDDDEIQPEDLEQLAADHDDEMEDRENEDLGDENYDDDPDWVDSGSDDTYED